MLSTTTASGSTHHSHVEAALESNLPALSPPTSVSTSLNIPEWWTKMRIVRLAMIPVTGRAWADESVYSEQSTRQRSGRNGAEEYK